MNNNSIKHIPEIIKRLKKQLAPFDDPVSMQVGKEKRNPFHVLISCVLSLRTKDTTMGPAAKRLFDLADNPYDMVKLSQKQIEKAIFPVGFYPTKAKWVKEICSILIKKYKGNVPTKEEDLLGLPGIGRKCMGIVMCYGFNKNSHIPVDTHVHKIANRLGWIKTKTPEQSEQALMNVIPKKHWRDINDLLVTHGQNICAPISPFCSKCSVSELCPKIGVSSRR